jgi:hypothetical protein
MNTQEFVGSLTKNQCRYLLRYAGFSCRSDEGRGDLRFAVERNLKAGTIGQGSAAKIFNRGVEEAAAELMAVMEQLIRKNQKQ